MPVTTPTVMRLTITARHYTEFLGTSDEQIAVLLPFKRGRRTDFRKRKK